jgi:LuxR family transcriptional regulator, maltose regulon positive regulatory protein
MVLPTIPQLGRFELTRPVLLSAIAQSVEVRAVALIAPSGYGKTTLLAQYARAATRYVVWVSLGEAEAGISGLIDALQKAIRGTECFSSTDFKSLESSPGRWARSLDDVEGNVDVIFDGLDALGAEALDWLSRFVLTLGEGHRALVSGWTLNGLSWSRGLAAGEIVVIDSARLAFDVTEIQGYLSLRGADTRITPYRLKPIEGWPAGVALAASGSAYSLRPEDLVTEAIERLPTAIRRVLPQAALFNPWSEAVAADLQLDLPPGWLEVLQRHGLPVAPLGEGLFRPHGVLIDFLWTRLRAMPADHARLAPRAAKHAERNGELSFAIRLYAAAGDTSTANRLAHLAVARHRSNGETRLVRQVLESLPEAALDQELRARLAFAFCETGEPDRASAWLEAMCQADDAHPMAFVVLAVIAGRRGDPRTQLDLARQAQARLLPGAFLPALAWPLVNALLGLGHLAEAAVEAQTFLDQAERAGDPAECLSALELLQYVLGNQRRYAERERVLVEAVERCERANLSRRSVNLRIELAKMLAITGSWDEAETQLGFARRHLDTGQPFAAALFEEAQGMIWAWRNQLQVARSHYETAIRYAQDNVAPGMVAQLRVCLEDLKPRPTLIAVIDTDKARLLEGKRRILAANPESAIEVLQSVSALAERSVGVRAAVLQGLLARDPLSLATARATFEAFDGSMVVGSLFELDGEVFRSLGYAEPPSTWVAANFGDVKPSKSFQLPTAPKLVLQLLGEFRVWLENEEITIQLHKSRELLLWLALNGAGNSATIASALWDGQVEERHQDYLRVALRRLRLALREHWPNDNPIPLERGAYRLGGSLVLQTDIAGMDTPLPETLESLEQEFSSYQQPLWAELDSEWISPWRQRCSERGVALGLKLARVTQAEQVEATLRAVIGLDPLCDEAHEALISWLLQTRQPEAASIAWTAYRRMLRESLGVPPDSNRLARLQALGLISTA